MRALIGIAVIVAIGLIWSVAAITKWVPVDGSEMKSATTSPHVGDQARSLQANQLTVPAVPVNHW